MSGESGFRVVPVTGRAAVAWVAKTHRHLPKVQGALFAAGVSHAGAVVGVATAGNPPRVWQGTGRFVITRVAALPGLKTVGQHAAPVCTMLYRSLCDAGRALGYAEAWTYTLPGEDGRSLRAAGFVYRGMTRAEDWDRPSRSRSKAEAIPKGRWMRPLTRAARAKLFAELEAEAKAELETDRLAA